MTLRFVRTTASGRPDFPFQAGQIIHVEKLTAEMRVWLRDGAAELLKEEPEAAVLGMTERAVEPRAKGRG